MNLQSKSARRAVAAALTAALLLSGCHENTVVENGDLPQSVDTVNELTSTTPEETTTEERQKKRIFRQSPCSLCCWRKSCKN